MSTLADTKCDLAKSFLKAHDLASPSSTMAFISLECEEYKNDKDAIYRIASLTKPIVATAIIKALYDKKLGVLLPISELIPELYFLDKKIDHKVTIFDLLTHTSGLPSRVSDDLEQDRKYITKKLAHLSRHDLTPYAKNYSYSNIGYMILGMVLEKLTNQSFHQYLNSSIFIPLKMHSTSFTLSDDLSSKRIVDGYLYGGKEKSKHPQLHGHAFGWGLYSSAHDLTKFVQFLLGNAPDKVYNSILPKEIVLSLTNPVISHEGEEVASLIMQVQKRAGNLISSHTGLIDGFNSSLIIDKENGYGTIILSNEYSKSALLGNNMFYDYLSTGLKDMFFKTDAKACMVQEMFGPKSFVCLEVPGHIKSQIPDYRVWK